MGFGPVEEVNAGGTEVGGELGEGEAMSAAEDDTFAEAGFIGGRAAYGGGTEGGVVGWGEGIRHGRKGRVRGRRRSRFGAKGEQSWGASSGHEPGATGLNWNNSG